LNQQRVKKKSVCREVHSLSTSLPQFFHTIAAAADPRVVRATLGSFMPSRCGAGWAAATLVLVLSLWPGARASAEGIDALLYRIFLRDGSTLVSYGDFTRLADKVVLSIPLGAVDGPSPALHLVSISEAAVDWDRTDRYAAATRARHYAATRGEADFSQLSTHVARALNDVAQTKDPVKRLELATEARRILTSWPASHYGYRASDVAQLAALLDDAVAELRAAAGLSRIDLALVATASPQAPDEPELPAPTPQESVNQALAAAAVAGDAGERVSLLQAIMDSLGPTGRTESSWSSLARAKAAAGLATELKIDKDYRDLVSRTIVAADDRARRADVNGIEGLLRSVLTVDDRLGRRRPDTTAALLATLDGKLNTARRLRLAQDAWAVRQRGLREYQGRIGSAVRWFRQSTGGLEQIRQLSGPSPSALQPLALRLTDAWAALKIVRPPAETEPVHAMLVNAMQMAIRAVASRRTAVTATDMQLAWEASSAAAGALLMFERAQEELKKLSTPPGL
jgi:hypothetical protein